MKTSVLRIFLFVPLVTIVLSSAPALAQDMVVTFPDPKLDTAIREAIGRPIGDIVESDLLDLESLTAQGVVDLTGIEYCSGLTYLSLENGSINNISPLSSLTKLVELSLKNNMIEDISSLSGLTDLTSLNVDGNQISSIVPLSGLTRLNWLAIADNDIADISPLSGLTELETLFAWGNRIEDISPLQYLTNLDWLNIEINQINSITPLSGLTRLNWLAIADNDVADISPLSSLTELETLFAWGNRIENISPLQNLTDLRWLNIESNQIEDISPLQYLTDLDLLNIESNQISSIAPLSGLTRLTYLSIADNDITDISPLYSLTELETLFAWGNRIEDISPLLPLSRLLTVDLTGNPLSTDSCSRYIPQLVERAVDVSHDCEPSSSVSCVWLVVGAVAFVGAVGVIIIWVRKHAKNRVTEAEPESKVTHAPVEVDENRREVLLDGRVLRPQLKGNEFRFTSLLYQNLGKAVSYEEIIEYVWQSTQSYIGITHQDVHQLASRVRNSLGRNTYGRYIKTVPMFGYRLDREFST